MKNILTVTHWLFLTAALALAATHLGFIENERTISTADIDHAEGFAFRTPFKAPFYLSIPSDDFSGLRQSRLALFEDGNSLGPPHAFHDRIRRFGKGAYSHWRNKDLLFSTSDDSDPRSNQKTYRIRYPVAAAWWLVLAAALPAAALSWLGWGHGWMRSMAQYSRRGLTWLDARPFSSVIMLLPVAAHTFYAFVLFVPQTPLFTGDTPFFLDFHPLRTIGYQLLLTVTEALFGDFSYTIGLKVGLYIVSVFFLVYAVHRLFGRSLVSLAVGVPALMDGSVLFYSRILMAESLFASLIVIHLGFALLTLETRSRLFLAATAATACLTATVRPDGYFLFIPLIFLTVLMTRKRLSCLLVVAATVAAVMTAQKITNFALRGSSSAESVAGLTTAWHIAHLIEPDSSTAYPDLSADLYRKLADYRQAALAANYEPPALKSQRGDLDAIIISGAVNYMAETHPEQAPSPAESIVMADEALMEIAINSIMRHPSEYALWVFNNYKYFWSDHILIANGNVGRLILYQMITREKGEQSNYDAVLKGVEVLDVYVREIERHNNRVFNEDEVLSRFRYFDYAANKLDDIFPYLAVFLLGGSLMFMLAAPFAHRLGPGVQTAAYLSLAIQAFVTLIVLVASPETRYANMMHVPFLVLLVSMIAAVRELLLKARGGGTVR